MIPFLVCYHYVNSPSDPPSSFGLATELSAMGLNACAEEEESATSLPSQTSAVCRRNVPYLTSFGSSTGPMFSQMVFPNRQPRQNPRPFHRRLPPINDPNGYEALARIAHPVRVLFRAGLIDRCR